MTKEQREDNIIAIARKVMYKNILTIPLKYDEETDRSIREMDSEQMEHIADEIAKAIIAKFERLSQMLETLERVEDCIHAFEKNAVYNFVEDLKRRYSGEIVTMFRLGDTQNMLFEELIDKEFKRYKI